MKMVLSAPASPTTVSAGAPSTPRPKTSTEIPRYIAKAPAMRRAAKADILAGRGGTLAGMREFKTSAAYRPTGDQPTAIATLTEGLAGGERYQTLVGATGTGKTATMAWTIEQAQKPALVIAHNKTLAAQHCK